MIDNFTQKINGESIGVGDYFSFYCEDENKDFLYKIIDWNDVGFKKLNILENTTDDAVYESIYEFVNEFKNKEYFVFYKSTKLNSLFLEKSDCYILYSDEYSRVITGELYTIDDEIAICYEGGGDIIVSGKNYNELIIKTINKYSTVIPVKDVVGWFEI